MKTSNVLLLAAAGVAAYLLLRPKAPAYPPGYGPGYMPPNQPPLSPYVQPGNAAALAAGAAAGTLIEQLITGDSSSMNGIPYDGE